MFLFCLFGNPKTSVADRTEVNETAEKLTHKNKADLNLTLKSTWPFYKFYALFFAVDFRFSLCYPYPPKRLIIKISQWKITVFADTVFVVSSHIGAVICFLFTWRNESLDGNRKSRWALHKKDSCTINLLQVYLPLQIVDLYKILSASGCYFVCNLSVLFRSSVHNYNVFVLSACFFWRLRKSPGRFFLKDGRVLAFIIIAGNQRHSDDGSLRWRGDIVCGGFPRDHVVVV